MLLGWVLGQDFLKQLRAKNISTQTCQEVNVIKTHNGHKALKSYLNVVGDGPEIFKTSWAQKSLSHNPS